MSILQIWDEIIEVTVILFILCKCECAIYLIQIHVIAIVKQ